MAARDVAVLVGSLRRESFTRRIALTLMHVAPASLRLEIVPIGDLEHYNQDLDPDSPTENWFAFRGRMRRAQAVLFATPEYNRSVPGVLKNAIDVGSRPKGKSVFAGKPAAVVSVSMSGLGGFGANHHLRQSLMFMDMPTMQQPEAYISGAAGLFDDRGELINESTREYLRSYMAAFENWVTRILR